MNRTFNTILVTGGAGFIGSNMIRYLLGPDSGFVGRTAALGVRPQGQGNEVGSDPRMETSCLGETIVVKMVFCIYCDLEANIFI